MVHAGVVEMWRPIQIAIVAIDGALGALCVACVWVAPSVSIGRLSITATRYGVAFGVENDSAMRVKDFLGRLPGLNGYLVLPDSQYSPWGDAHFVPWWIGVMFMAVLTLFFFRQRGRVSGAGSFLVEP